MKDDEHDGQPFFAKIDGPEALSRAVHAMTNTMLEMQNKAGGFDGMAMMEICSSAALGALCSGASTLCKKGEDIPTGRITKERGKEIMLNHLKPEVFIFAALVAANQAGEIQEHDENHMGLVATFGSHCFVKALEQWSKIFPDKKIEDYIERGCIELCRKAMADEATEDAFNQTITAKPGFIMRNNGSIN